MEVLSSGKSKKSKIGPLEIRKGLEGLTPARILTLYRRAPLLRPASDPASIWKMFEQSSLVLTAWHEQRLVGIARVLSDGVVFSYFCDLAVEPDVQGLGIGKALINRVFEECAGTELLVREAGVASSYYSQLGFKRVSNAWIQVCR